MTKQGRIILADDQLTNLTVGREALCDEYEVFTVPSGEKLLLLLEKVMPDIILLDIEMPGMNGYEAIISIKANPRTKDIPIIFLTSKSDIGSELRGLSLGAVDYIYKPFSPPLLKKRIEQNILIEQQKRDLMDYASNLEEMVKHSMMTILELQNAVLETVAELVESRDGITGGHITRSKKYLEILIDEILRSRQYFDETSFWDVGKLTLSALLHDVGKIAISDSILQKPGKLTDEEFEEMKSHTLRGGEVIEKIQSKTTNDEFLEYARVLAVYHHERWNGMGYPYGLSGEAIPLPARLMAIADVYDALTSERSYKKRLTHDEAQVIIEDGRGTMFDPILVDAFLNAADLFKKVSDEHNGH